MISKNKRIPRALFPTVMKGRVVHGSAFSLRIITSKAQSKLAVVVSKTIAKSAVKRNTLRRRFYDAAYPLLPKTGIYAIFLKKPSISSSFKEIQAALKSML